MQQSQLGQRTSPPWAFIAALRSELISALLFTLFLIVWEAAVLGIDYVNFIHNTTTLGYQRWTPSMEFGLLIAIVCAIMLTAFFVWVSLKSGRNVRIFCLLFFAFVVLYEYGYQGALHRFSTAEDMMMAARYTDATLFKDAILSYLNWQAVPPIAVYALLLGNVQPQTRVKWSVILLMLSIAMLSFTVMSRVWFVYQAPFPTPALSGFFRSASYLPWKLKEAYHGPRDPLDYRATTRPANNIVFIVDESIRADHLSVNGYERSTTPYLDQLAQRGVLHNWGSAVSGATCSLESNNLLLTGITALPDTTQQIQRQPSIFQYAQAMGYTTHYLDSSNQNFWNGTKDDLRFIDHWENASRFTDGALYDADMRLAQHTRSVLETSTGNFIWINKRGVHFVYNNTFPHTKAQWAPIMSDYTHDLAHREEIRNSYDNGVRYNAETFWRSLITDPAVLSNTVVVYTSDHGQTLAEHDEPWTHCNASRNEALVPLFMLADGDYPVDPRYRASHANIFATLLDLMQFPQAERRYSYARSLFGATAADSERRQYFVDSLDSTAGDGFRWFDP